MTNHSTRETLEALIAFLVIVVVWWNIWRHGTSNIKEAKKKRRDS